MSADFGRLEEEAADWFTPALVARVDDEFIPAAALARLNNRAGGERRRSSVGGSMREAVAGTASSRERRSSRGVGVQVVPSDS